MQRVSDVRKSVEAEKEGKEARLETVKDYLEELNGTWTVRFDELKNATWAEKLGAKLAGNRIKPLLKFLTQVDAQNIEQLGNAFKSVPDKRSEEDHKVIKQYQDLLWFDI